MKTTFKMGNVKVTSNDPEIPVTVNVDGIETTFEATTEEFIAYGKTILGLATEFVGAIKAQMAESKVIYRSYGQCGSDAPTTPKE